MDLYISLKQKAIRIKTEDFAIISDKKTWNIIILKSSLTFFVA